MQLMPELDALGRRFLATFANGATQWHEVVEMYSTPPRAYHNLDHIRGCLSHFDTARHLADHPRQIEAAIWFHDCIYDPKAHDNEARSADVAERMLGELGFARDFIDESKRLILATTHSAAPADNDTALLVDIDLAILGAESSEFDRYERAIRQEYAHVPDRDFALGRSAILRKFLKRPSIYTTEDFRSRFENRARENLARSVANASAS